MLCIYVFRKTGDIKTRRIFKCSALYMLVNIIQLKLRHFKIAKNSGYTRNVSTFIQNYITLFYKYPFNDTHTDFVFRLQFAIKPITKLFLIKGYLFSFSLC